MILLLGATSFIGRAFARELALRGEAFIPLTPTALDYTRFELLFDYLRKVTPEFLINATGYSGNPNVDFCEVERLETFQQNTLLPQKIARACLLTNTPWGHVSSACIYSGAKIFENGHFRAETHLNHPEVRAELEAHPERFAGFDEEDDPNFSFRDQAHSFWSGTVVLAEESLREQDRTYIWRPGVPFNECDEPANLLSKLQKYFKVYDHVTPLSETEDFAGACLDLWSRRAPFGIYNLHNPGVTSTRRIVEMIDQTFRPSRPFQFWVNEEEFLARGRTARRASCIVDGHKAAGTGIHLRTAEQALGSALCRWRPGSFPCEPLESQVQQEATVGAGLSAVRLSADSNDFAL